MSNLKDEYNISVNEVKATKNFLTFSFIFGIVKRCYSGNESMW